MEQSISVPRNTDTLFSRPFPQGMKKVRGEDDNKIGENDPFFNSKILVRIKELYVMFNITSLKKVGIHHLGSRREKRAIMVTKERKIFKFGRGKHENRNGIEN